MKTYKLLLLISLFFTLGSCVEDAKNIDLPEENPKLVVTSFLSPNDTAIALQLSWSKPIYGLYSNGEYKMEPNAIVKVSTESAEYTLAYNQNLKCYFSNHNEIAITAGKKYSLYVKEPNGSSITSECVIPSIPNLSFEFIRVDSTMEYDQYYSYQTLYKVTNNSTDASKNLFNICFWDLVDYNMLNDTNWQQTENFLMQIDAGKTKMVNVYSWANSFNDIKRSKAVVLQVDDAYYRYNRNAENGYNSSPFAEPVINFSNINNGLGVFCGFNQKTFFINR